MLVNPEVAGDPRAGLLRTVACEPLSCWP